MAAPLSRFILFSLTVLKRKDMLIQYNKQKMQREMTFFFFSFCVFFSPSSLPTLPPCLSKINK